MKLCVTGKGAVLCVSYGIQLYKLTPVDSKRKRIDRQGTDSGAGIREAGIKSNEDLGLGYQVWES